MGRGETEKRGGRGKEEAVDRERGHPRPPPEGTGEPWVEAGSHQCADPKGPQSASPEPRRRRRKPKPKPKEEENKNRNKTEQRTNPLYTRKWTSWRVLRYAMMIG